MKVILTLLLCILLVTSVFGQAEINRTQTVTTSGVIRSGDQFLDTLVIHIGVPYMGRIEKPTETVRNTSPVDVRFPWGLRFLFKTFAKNGLQVSKGDFVDQVLLSWEVKKNEEKITSFTIYRRLYDETITTNTNWGNPIARLGASALQYEDRYVEGGSLYEYKLVAEGIDDTKEIERVNYTTGIGFRNPTATITGNVSFDGGNPVKDVLLIATADGAATNLGSALRVPESSEVRINGLPKLNQTITAPLTLQAWIKPVLPYLDDAGPAMNLFSVGNLLDVKVNLKATSNILELDIGGQAYELKNYFPSGRTNRRGDDVLIPVSSFNSSFVHFSVTINNGIPLLYINGRAINEEYSNELDSVLRATNAENYNAPYFEVINPVGNTPPIEGASSITLGGGKEFIVDEIRIWDIALNPDRIRSDFGRYISGNDLHLLSYLSANENQGEVAYDLSRTGFDFHRKQGNLKDVIWVDGLGNVPNADQLGIVGVTDKNGNYQISSIPYSGAGESFTITPLFGQHQFEPSQQLVYLGEGSEVVNQLNFTDKSSFVFKGEILYDSRNVFPSVVEANGGITDLIEGTDYVSVTGTFDEGYNFYIVNSIKYSKGRFWYNEQESRLERYATVFSEGANVYIDGNIVLDENSVPVVSDQNGSFEISVPIGDHYISIKKNGHTFGYQGRFPSEPGEYEEFFEDRIENVTFIDSTRVTLVGRVVGGPVEAAKPIGFGADGFYEYEYADEEGISDKVIVSSKNNIGVAEISLGYAPSGSAEPETTFSFNTNSTSGEYRVNLLPLRYELRAQDINISSNSSISIIDGGTTQVLDLVEIKPTTTPEFEYEPDLFIYGEPYNYEKSFTYRTTPILKVIEQTSDEIILINGVQFITEGFEYPVYTQLREEPYRIQLNSFERYINNDGADPVNELVAVVDGELKITNNLALPGSEEVKVDKEDPSIINYTFKGGLPNISPPFTRSISIEYLVNGVAYPAEDLITSGIVLGGQSDGSREFITQAPEIPAIILRDPPGSNSFASIEEGESITISSQSQVDRGLIQDNEFKLLLGARFEAGGGLAGPVITTESRNNVTAGVGFTLSSSEGRNTTSTYNFTETISTSDDPNWVGADADLYIGSSNNQFQSTFDNVQVSNNVIGEIEANYELTNSFGQSIYVSKQKGLSLVDEPTGTFFIYTQRYILETLIPEIEQIISNIENGLIEEGTNGVGTLLDYQEQVKLWKFAVLNNELQKYQALNDRDDYKNDLDSVVIDFKDEIKQTIEFNRNFKNGLERDKNLLDTLNELTDDLFDLIDENFEENISFDAGIGSISRSIQTSIVNSSSFTYTRSVDESIALQLGFEFNKFGFSTTNSAALFQDREKSLSRDKNSTSTIQYTLADNDDDNIFSIDVINSFDGNGPIFITLGGSSSCPWEGAEASKFYTNEQFKNYFNGLADLEYEIKKIRREILEITFEYSNGDVQSVTNLFNLSNELIQLEIQLINLELELANIEIDLKNEDGDKGQLSFATQKVEVPLISVVNATQSNIPEGRNAEFTLLLENQSATESDASFLLVVDNTTNPNNANINIEPNGTIVNVPYGETTTYTMTLGKSVTDVYDYENIKVILSSICDGDVFSEVDVTANFVPSCTNVTVNAPLKNWVYNQESASTPLTVTITDFDTEFSSFEKIDLEYRLSSSPNWISLETFTPENEISLNYQLDIPNSGLQDGQYEIRARSSCTNDTEFISDVITGRVDLTAPVKFGTPTPIDGILGPGEDLKLRFNEPVFFNSAVSVIEIKGETNQLPINNNVSLRFEGVQNNALINSPALPSGDLTIEFWMNNSTVAANASIIEQEDGLSIGLEDGQIYFTLGGQTAKGEIRSDGLFHHYTFSFNSNSTSSGFGIYEDDQQISTQSVVSSNANNNPLIIGGSEFIGNIHSLRIWNKTIGLDEAFAKMFDQLNGNEADLIGYWPMNEGRGSLALDLARFKHAEVNTGWDIKPKGSSYEFSEGNYIIFEDAGFVLLTDEMDATLSFWMQTETSQDATLFSNGKGDGTDSIQTNGKSNKWAINMSASGELSLDTEGDSYSLTTESVADGQWHHIALLFNRNGSLRSYVDADQTSSHPIEEIGGFSHSKIWVGARGSTSDFGIDSVDRFFIGKIDELRLWNTLRNVEQIDRDRYNEVDIESIGLLLYARMNVTEGSPTEGPRYYQVAGTGNLEPGNAALSNDLPVYSEDSPTIKLERSVISIPFTQVISGGEIIIEPDVVDWAALEGQILDITVHRLFDDANNRQESPVTWTAFVNQNEVSWFVDGYSEIVDLIQNTDNGNEFEINLINRGGLPQPYTIANVPDWITLSRISGTLSPNSEAIISASVDSELNTGNYLENLYLQTEFGYDQKLQVQVKVLADEPDWSANPGEFTYSMNVIGQVQIDGVFSDDTFDKVAAFIDGEVRGVTYLEYDESYQEYFVFLTIYSDEVDLNTVSFSIWDASQGKISSATIDGINSINFSPNAVRGSLSVPAQFENSGIVTQEITLNKGFTWVSFNVNDPDFLDLNSLTQSLDLNTVDRILSNSPTLLETYFNDDSNPDRSSWSGQISQNGGLAPDKMYKMYLSKGQKLTISGEVSDVNTWTFPVKENWNWLPYPLRWDRPINEALAYFSPSDGDVIKSQSLFAIYDTRNGWIGTLKNMKVGQGYMIRAAQTQEFSYPSYLNEFDGARAEATLERDSYGSFKKFSQNMNAVVQLPEGFDELRVYDESGVLKGIGQNMLVEGQLLSFVTIYGDITEELTYYVGKETENRIAAQSFNFKSNEVLGSIAKPVQLELMSTGIVAYPLPFEDDLTVRIEISSSSGVSLLIFELGGKQIHAEEHQLSVGINYVKITPIISRGTYLLKVISHDGEYTGKIIKN